MTDIDLTTVPLSALTAELKRRMQEFESAKKELGFGSAGVENVRRARVSAPRKAGGNSTMKQAAEKRWEGWDEYRSKHPNAKPKEFFQWKKKQSK